MKTFIIRSGKGPQCDRRLLKEQSIFLRWTLIETDLSGFASYQELRNTICERNPGINNGYATEIAGQIWMILHQLEEGDLVLMPSGNGAGFHIGRVCGSYSFRSFTDHPSPHFIPVEWLKTNVPYEHIRFKWAPSLRVKGYVRPIIDRDAAQEVLSLIHEQRQIDTVMHFNANRPASKTVVPPLAAHSADPYTDLIDKIYQQISAKQCNHPHIIRNIIKAVLRLQGAIVERLKTTDKECDEFLVTVPSDRDDKELITMIVHRIPFNKFITCDAIDACAERVHHTVADYGFIISWNDKAALSDTLTVYASGKSVACFTSRDLIEDITRLSANISPDLKHLLSDKLLFALSRRISDDFAISPYILYRSS